jgi:hypothetical protein
MGTPHYAKEILQTLIDDREIEIPLVITQPDRKAGRRGDLKPPAVKVLAEKYDLEILQPEKLCDDGVYESEIFDLGSSAKYLVYAEADNAVTGVGTTWDDVIPDPNTWESISISTKTWTEIFELSAGPSVEIPLLYGDSSPPTNEVKKMEILGTVVTGRYFQVKITITDPSAAINALVEAFSLRFCQ